MPSTIRALLISCYELGHQPLALAQPLAFLDRAGVRARAIDLAVDPLDEEAVREADFIGVSVPMHTALRIGLSLAERLRELNSGAHLCFYGLYATLNAELLLEAGADSVLGGESEEELVSRAIDPRPRDLAHRLGAVPAPVRERLDFPVPLRSPLPSIDRYVELRTAEGEHVPVGAVETTRGCLHLCRHCPIPPVYGGRFFALPRDVVLEDIRRLVADGARHIDFVDPDFLNGPGQALAVTRAMHAEFPDVTFDFTAKVEHLLRHRHVLPELRDLGCLFIVSAVESLSDRVLEELDKGHSCRDVFDLLALSREAGITLRPTFVAFTPWTEPGDYLELLRWIAEEGLVEAVDPVQLTLRLLIPPGSLLLENESLRPVLGELDPRALTHRWTHPDPRMDELQRRTEAVVAGGLGEGRTSRELFDEVASLALELEGPAAVRLLRLDARPAAPAPRLTEAWFC